MKNSILSALIVSASLFLTTLSNSALAGLIVVDGGTNGKSSSCLFSCSNYFQQVYDGDLFGGSLTIDSISFLVGANPYAWADNNSWEMTLSTLNNGVGNLSTDFDTNISGDASVFATQSFTGTSQLGELITFNGSYDFDPTAGNDLLISLRALGDLGGASLISDLDSNGEFSIAYSAPNNAFASSDSLFLKADDGLMTNFNVTLNNTGSVTVPEPSSLAVMMLGLFGLAGARKLKKG